MQREATPTDMVRSLVLPSSPGDGMCDISVALPPATATAPLTLGAPRQPQWGFGGRGGCSNNVKVSSAGASLHRGECQPLFNWARLREERLVCLPQQVKALFTFSFGDLLAREQRLAHRRASLQEVRELRTGAATTALVWQAWWMGPERARATHPYQPRRLNTAALLLPGSQRETLFGPLPKQPDGEQGR